MYAVQEKSDMDAIICMKIEETVEDRQLPAVILKQINTSMTGKKCFAHSDRT
jgi:hypothetical protein